MESQPGTALIRVLSPELADLIAAGEVVERPASVVKELCENAIDAGATKIEVAVKEGGRRLIQVVDNGSGMTAEDARLALRRHATSKLTAAEQLWGIATLGFRGEALPSIAAVSRLSLSTKPASAAAGMQLDVVGGHEKGFQEVGVPQGTRVEIRDLFFNTPARLKFLKSDSRRPRVRPRLYCAWPLATQRSTFAWRSTVGRRSICRFTGPEGSACARPWPAGVLRCCTRCS
jgi:DNA mismatch repair protein MutL